MTRERSSDSDELSRENGFSREDWRAFCRDLEALGDIVATQEFAKAPLDQAEGYRYLTRLLRIGLEMQLENADPAFPSFYQASHETAKIGADNPDNHYLNATVSGAARYRLTGNRGDAPILSFGTKANRYAIDGTMASTGELDARDMTFSENGDFEITVSADKADGAEGDWLPMQADTSMLLVRQTYFDKTRERRATVRIERLDAGAAAPAPLEGRELAGALSRTLAFVGGTARTFASWADDFREQALNKLNTVDQQPFIRAGGDPSIFYLHGWWKLAPHEALRIDTPIPPCEGWNFQLNNVWLESLDYRHQKIHVNNGTARLNDDGSATIVVAPRDIGVGNWIDTCGHEQGAMLFRWTGATTHPVPHTEVISLK